jgi:hypothetical protein
MLMAMLAVSCRNGLPKANVLYRMCRISPRQAYSLGYASTASELKLRVFVKLV